MHRAAFVAGVLVLSCGLGAGCHPEARIDALEKFPQAKDRGAAVDIQVTRDVTTISFTNTTAQDLPAGVIWVNSAFSHKFPGLGVGQSITMNLGEFRNRYGEGFRAGGFFSTQRPDVLVRVQVETEEDLVGLTVIAAAND